MQSQSHAVIQRLNLLFHLRRSAVFNASFQNGLYPGQLPILEYIIHHEGCTQNEIAQKLSVSPASIASSAKRLQKANLIRKKTDEYNLRRNMLFVTEKGLELAESCRQECNRFDRALIDSFTEKELETLGKLLDRMVQNLQPECGCHCTNKLDQTS